MTSYISVATSVSVDQEVPGRGRLRDSLLRPVIPRMSAWATLCALAFCAGGLSRGPTVEFYLAEDYRFSPAGRRTTEALVRIVWRVAEPILPWVLRPGTSLDG
jgi:hypothetical protein